MTPNELERALTVAFGNQLEEAGEDYYEDYSGKNLFYHQLAGTGNTQDYRNPRKAGDTIEVEGVGTFEFIETESQYDEAGDLDYKLVFSLDGQTFVKEGYLDSWSGGVWDGPLYEVTKVTKTVEVWERL